MIAKLICFLPKDAISEFSNHQLIEPVVFDTNGKIITRHKFNVSVFACAKLISIKNIIILLQKYHCSQFHLLKLDNLQIKLLHNKQLIPNDYFEKFHKNGSWIFNSFSSQVNSKFKRRRSCSQKPFILTLMCLVLNSLYFLSPFLNI